MNETPNPFHFGKAVAGTDFCPRPALEAALRSKLLSGQNLLVQGYRRRGKTSVIRRVAQSLPGYKEVYVDLYGTRSTPAVVQKLAHSIASVDRSSKWGTTLGQALSFVSVTFSKGGFSLTFNSPAKLSLGSVDEIFDFLHKHRNGKWVVIIDEFQDVLKIEDVKERETLIAHLRSRIQFLDHTPFVFAGSTRNLMHGIFYHPQSPFYKSAETLEVGPIDRADFTAWLNERFSAGSRTVTPDAIERVYAMADDVPGDVQQFCSAIWDVTAPGSTFTTEELPRALCRIWEQEQRSNEAIVEGSTSLQLKCLIALATRPELTPTSSEFLMLTNVLGPSVLRSFQKYEKDGVLIKEGSKYAFVNPYFREWLKSRFGSLA